MPLDPSAAESPGVAPFEPIAIVGQGCVLPGCDSPEALWALVHDGLDATAMAAPGLWGTGADPAEVPWTTRGGYVEPQQGRPDPSRLAWCPDALPQLDAVFQWSLCAAQQAMAGVAPVAQPQRGGVVLGNLSYPTALHSRWVEQTWVRELVGASLPAGESAHPLNRWMSGLPAMVVARALGLQGGSMALDAACASGLYALKLACDRLHDRSVDVMLAGAVNAADQLFLHAGFHALQALSPSGRSRPFQQGADGLLPAEGAVFVALKRLSDAQAQGDTILGVIRGVGLSNDGRSGGFLSPSQEGQVRAMRSALRQAGLPAEAVQYVECHATGTQLGDATEIASLSAVYGARALALGSLKANLGHLITASGLAGLVKTLAAMRHGRLPATPGATPLSDAVVRSGFDVLAAPRDWPAQAGQRTAAVSSFGFGGNNAHLIVQQHAPAAQPVATARPVAAPQALAIVGLGVRTHQDADAPSWARRMWGLGPTVNAPLDEAVQWPARGLSFPPADLKKALGQQLLAMEAARQACAHVAPLDGATTGVYVGMQTDTEVSRHGARARWAQLMAHSQVAMGPAEQARMQEALAAPLDAATVIGTMPNVVANRLSSHHDLRQPGFSVSREELSGDAALALACRALRHGEAQTALVAAVDLCREPASQAAMLAWPALSAAAPADAAVALVIKTAEQAQRDGDQPFAWLWPEGEGVAVDAVPTDVTGPALIAQRLGHAHAAQGLLNLALGVQALRARVQPGAAGQPVQPLLSDGQPLRLRVVNEAHAGEQASWTLQAASEPTWRVAAAPACRTYAAPDAATLLARLQRDEPGGEGPCRLAWVGEAERWPAVREAALASLRAGRTTQPWALDGVCFQPQAVPGEVAFVFTGAASAYAGMGRDLLLGLPQLAQGVAERVRNLRAATGWAHGAAPVGPDEPDVGPMAQLAGASALCQLHAAFTQQVLGLRPQAALGLSSGETNALFALGAWRDIDGLLADIDVSGLYDRELSGRFEAVREHWGLSSEAALDWQSYRVRAPVAEIRSAVAAIDRVYLTIVNSPMDAVIGGDAAACERLLQALGRPPAVPLGHDLAVHCAAVGRFGPEWRRLHTRPTVQPEGIRFYASHHAGPYALSDQAVADALTGQALTTADFSRVVERAWQDGVRVFIEHGPRNTLSAAIGETLGERPHLAVALDRAGVSSLHQAWWAAAQLWCAGVPVDLAALSRASGAEPLDADLKPAGPSLRFALRPPSPWRAVWPAAPAAEPAGAMGALHRAPAIHAGPADAEPLALAPALRCPGHVDAVASAIPAVPAIHVNPPAAQVLPVPQAVSEPAVAAPVVSPVQAPVVSVAPQPEALPPAMHLLLTAHARMAEAHSQHLAAQQQAMAALMGAADRWRQMALGAAPPVSQPVAAPQLPMAPAGPERPAVAVAEPVASPVTSPAVAPGLAAQPTAPRALPGPRIDRAQLEVLAGGRISEVLGPAFAGQDGYAVQVRMPQPPLLLCDRVLGIEGEHHSMGRGTIWTETDVRADAWYMHHGRMSPGVFIESGQADLLLISWLGIDDHNRGERAYRLLGCELVFHGDLPKPGETLSYEIKVDGHARQGDVRLFFFHYDCHVNGELRISVRQGQAGFFTREELAHSAGVIWSPEEAAYTPQPEGAEPLLMATQRRSFTTAQMRDYLDGDLPACFGDSHRFAATHNRTPRGPSGRLNLLGQVTQLDPKGGPAGRGYLRIETDVHPDDWYFDGHFKNDPCMPGTLMADACLQAMSFYMVAMGLTLPRDGWRFQPVRGERHRFLCRGQVTPASERIVYEVFVDECLAGPQPRLYAHLLCTVDGRKAFLCERAGLELVPDWPLATLLPALPPGSQPAASDDRPVAHIDGLPLNHATLQQCAWGRPSDAFGPRFQRYDGPMRSPRLPGPPYHFMTRITALQGEQGRMQPGATVTALYDIDPDAWYFRDQPMPSMPNCVLLEAVLQPCGWLAVYTLDPSAGASELLFRNLDGHWHQTREVRPTDRTLRTDISLVSVSRVGAMIIEKFEVRCSVDGEPVLTLDTVFGFFPPEALADQKGLPHDERDLAQLQAPGGDPIELREQPPRLFGASAARLPEGQLLMIDRITGHWPQGGAQGLGLIRAEKDVRVEEWFFKAHFFQDPVQPGSLGIEAILQAAQSLMLLQGLDEGLIEPCFEPLAVDTPVVWHYRGQVTPQRQRVTVVYEVTSLEAQAQGVLVVGQGQLWVDGMLAYRMPSFGMRLKSSPAALTASARPERPWRSPFLAADGSLDWRALRADWLRRHPQIVSQPALTIDLCVALLRRFVRGVHGAEPDTLASLVGRPALYMANHQTGVESMLGLGVLATLSGMPVSAIAKSEHAHSWMGRLLRRATAELGPHQPLGMLLFDRARPEAMLSLLHDFAQAQATTPRSLLVHVEGTRARQANQAVTTVSAVLIDLALSLDLPIVPLRFAGGLPVDALPERAEFPHGLGQQDIHVGAPLWPADLKAMPLAERTRCILAALNGLGPAAGEERPNPARPADVAQVQSWVAGGMDPVQAVLRLALQTCPLRHPQALDMLAASPFSGPEPVSGAAADLSPTRNPNPDPGGPG
ncbi:MAG: hypothetical protein RI907_383 [Pseudomonadota bacterium]|jgi:acyl transferase domain-containing protein/3-hydroxymyristoyl/3-hydroxydecanoyl-(acyl carrier protein) dehydratase/1-acyl-sn-glycerol-3-phosphate acyltransferase